MFKIMSDSYKGIARKPIHVEKFDNCQEKFKFFVAKCNSTTLTTVLYSILDLIQLIRNFKTLSLQSLNLSKEYEKLGASEKSVVAFNKRYNENLDQEKKNFDGF